MQTAVRVLAIETSTTQASVALLDGGRVALERAHERPKQSAERLLPMIAEMLGETGWPRGSLDRIGVSIGPGSFTGLRIGIACAQGLALGLGVPLIGVSSLQAMARAAPDSVPGIRWAVLDAHRGEVFVGAYQPGPRAAEVQAPQVVSTTQARAMLEEQRDAPVVLVGGGLALLGLNATVRSPETLEPRALALGLLAGVLDPARHPPLPLYIRGVGATLPDLEASPER